MNAVLQLFPDAPDDLTQVECEQRIQALRRLHVDEIDAFWAGLSGSSVDHRKGARHDLSLLKRDINIDIHPVGTDALRKLVGRWCELADVEFVGSYNSELIAVISNKYGYLCAHQVASGPIYGRDGDLPGIDDPACSVSVSGYSYASSDIPGYDMAQFVVYGQIDFDLENWNPVILTPTEQSVMMDYLGCTRSLTGRKGTSWLEASTPLPQFDSVSILELLELESHLRQIHERGCASAASTAEMRLVRDSYASELRRLETQRAEIEAKARRVREGMHEAMLRALESQTGFKRGWHIQHRTTGRSGVLVASAGGSADFSIDGDQSRWRVITPELRRGEWVVVRPEE